MKNYISIITTFVFKVSIITVLYSIILSAQELTIGVPDFKDNFNILASNHPLASILSESICANVVSLPTNSSGDDYSMDLIKKIKFSNTSWEMTLKEELYFSNQDILTAEDVIFSFERCKEQGVLNNIKDFSRVLEQDKSVVINFQEKPDLNSAIKELASCPILNKKASLLFGDELGVGSNIVCSGNYFIALLKKGSEYHLSTSMQLSEGQPKDIAVKVIANDEEGLRLLRAGKLVKIFISGDEILIKAKDDPTLKSGVCKGHKWIARHDLDHPCEDSFDVSLIRAAVYK